MDYAFPGTGAARDDCPRPTQRNDYIANWAGATGNGWVSSYFSFDESNETYGQMTDPDGVTHKEIFYTANGKRGLPSRMETWSGSAIQQFTDLTWVSESSSGRPLRPRVTETKICDDRNHNGTYDSGTDKLRKMTVEYAAYASTVQLPWIIKEYNEGGQTVYRTKVTTYVNSSNYTGNTRRIIGLPQFTYLYAGDQTTLVAQMEYVYDSANESGTTFLQAHASSPRQHDTTNYGTGFTYRGNLTEARRYSVTGGTAGSPIETKTGYYITGSVAFTKDALNQQTSIVYDDSFLHYTENAGTLSSTAVTPNPATYAYPTKVTSPPETEYPSGISSTVSYNYDFGAVTRTVDPREYATNGNSPRTMGISTYDSKGRLDKSLVWKDNAKHSQTRYVYGNDHNYAETWTTVNSLSEETFIVHLLDGAGSERITISEHPGSVGGLKLQYQVFDKMRRVIEVSNPTEINGYWSPVGDDSAGYGYSTQAYDWKGRPTVKTDQLGKTSSVTYDGCGCAGSDVTTITDEGTVITNGGGQPEAKKRQQKIFRDVLGRVFKTQTLNWEGGSTYSTTITAYNVRDQITSVKEYSGNANGTENCPSATCQITTMDYDGHGRLWKHRRPIETADNVYLYNDDDTLWKHTDPRNVTATYTYNNRKLTTGIAFDSMPNAVLPSQLPSRPIPSANVTFGYDQVGNRIWMDDAPGRVDYVYDQLDRLKEETRLFDASAVSRSFTLKYDYNLAGQLKQITDPWNAVVNYNMDKAGQETGITATGYKDVNQWTNRTVGAFASNIKYRAWGGIKQFSNGTLSGNSSFAMGYDARLRLTSFTGGNRTTQHSYYDDGLVKEVTDLHYGSNFLRKYEYDHVSQLKKAHAGGTAQTSSSPYSLTYNYDVWGHTTSRTGSHWSNALTAFSTTFTDDRDNNMTFDAAGNVKGYTTNNDPYIHYNAASQLFTQFESGTLGLVRVRENYYDGDGAKVLYKTYDGSLNNGSYSLFCDYFLIRSSVLGGRVLAEFKDLTTYAENDPLKYSSKSYVYLKGVQLGFQMDAHKTTGDKFVVWMYHNPTVGNYFAEYQLNNSGGQQVNFPYGEMTFDPLGSYVGISQPPQALDIPAPFTFVMGQFMEASTGKCYADYVETRCEVVQQMLNNGTGNYAPLNNTDSLYNPITKRNELALFTVDWDNGFFGFVPIGANYNGDGSWSWANPRNGRPKLKQRGAAAIGDETSNNLASIKLTLFFSGIHTGKEKKNQASAAALPGLLDCLGLFQGQIQQLHNDNGVFSALAAAPNKDAAEAARNIVQQFLTDGGSPSQIQIVAHSNGNPTAKYFLDLMTRSDPSFRVGSTVLVAPNVDSTSTVDSIFSRSNSNILMQSNRDFALRLARILTGSSERIGAFQREVKSPANFIQTKQRGHGIQNYRKAYCGY